MANNLPVISVAEFRQLILTDDFIKNFPEMKAEADKYRTSHCGACVGNIMRGLAGTSGLRKRFEETYKKTFVIGTQPVPAKNTDRRFTPYPKHISKAELSDLVTKEPDKFKMAFPELANMIEQYIKHPNPVMLENMFRAMRSSSLYQRFRSLMEAELVEGEPVKPKRLYAVVIAKADDFERALKEKEFNPVTEHIENMMILDDGRLFGIIVSA